MNKETTLVIYMVLKILSIKSSIKVEVDKRKCYNEKK